jgi:hypothetical protein
MTDDEKTALLRECRAALDDLLADKPLLAAKLCGTNTLGNLRAMLYAYRAERPRATDHARHIARASSPGELAARLETAAAEYGIQLALDASMGYAEQAEVLRSEADRSQCRDDAPSLRAMADLLDAADARLHEVNE